MSKYESYQAYKDSSIEWIGRIPSHWRLSRISQEAYIVNGYPFDSNLFSSDFGIPLVRIRDIGNHTASTYFKGDVPKTAVIDSGDTLVGMDGDFNVRIWTGGRAALNQRVACVRAKTPSMQRYIFYALPFQLKIVNDLTYFTTVKHLSSRDIEKAVFPCPPESELKAVALFLDRETSKIDCLIEKQKRLIELLKEKSQAVISHAVIKGLNPDTQMKDSGVEWLGEVPENWVVSKFRYLSLVVRGGSPRPAGDPTLFNGDYSPWVTVAEITKDNEVYLDSTETFLTKLGSEQCRVFKSGTLLLSNSGATLGVPKILRINANANDGVVGFECLSPKLDIEFAYYYLASLTSNLRERINQGSGQPNLNTDLVKDIFLPLPSLEEQQAIVGYVKLTLNKFDSIKSSSEKMMNLLQERRKALISAAVTGKIDVRNQVPQDVEEAVAS